MIKRLLIVLLGLAIVFGGVFGWRAFVNYKTKQFLSSRKQPAVTVSATHAKAETWHPSYEAVGTLEAVQGVDVTSEVAGLVVKINFDSGQTVKKGELLVQLNDAPDRAKLQGLEAQATYARVQFERDKELLGKRGVSKSQYDQDQSSLDNARAQVQNQKALLAQKAITAPFSGRLGIRRVDLGQYLSPGTAVVTLQSLNPILVNFTLPQEDLKELSVGLPIEISVDAYDGTKFAGKITTISPKIDVNTRNIPIQATLQNPQELLRPGMFAQVRIILPEKQNVVTLPETAVTYNPYGDTVFVIKESKGPNGKQELTVHSVVVTTGTTRGDQVSISAGVKAGDWVVTAGQLKLKNGTHVTINNSVTPSNNPSPKLPNT